MQAITGRLTQAGARPMAWTPAISAPLNLESLKGNDEPLDDPRATEQLPELVAADVKGSLAGLGTACFPDPAAAARAVRETAPARRGEGAAAARLRRRANPATCIRARPGRRSTSGCAAAACPAVRAIRAATHDAATAMGVGHESGAISPGKIADIIAVRGDVLRNPGLLQSVDIVVKAGRRVR